MCGNAINYPNARELNSELLSSRDALDTNDPPPPRSLKIFTRKNEKSSCLDVAKEERDLEKEAPSVTAKSCVITSRVSPSPLSVVWLVVVV